MRRLHFETLRPVCPVCRAARGPDAPALLRLAHVDQETSGHIIAGVLHCTNPGCLHEFPIIDGIPIIVSNLRAFVSDQIHAINSRDDLGATLESLIGDCCGPASSFDQTRQHLSNYTWGHYADLDPGETQPAGAMIPIVRTAAELTGAFPPGPLVDIGCSVGRGTFELAARSNALVLGVDLNFPMLRLAAAALRDGVVRYPRRRVGLVYDRREFPVSFAGADRVDFWACDALALPCADGAFSGAMCLNLFDCVSDPRALLVELARSLQADGKAVIACPYDWSPNATAVEAWIGGHSQRTPTGGSSEAILRSLLTPGAHPSAVEGLELTAERDDVPWSVRLHDRSAVHYRLHMVGAQRRLRLGSPGAAVSPT